MGLKARTRGMQRMLRPDLALRGFRSSDVESLFALIEENRAYLREWMPWLDLTRTAEGARAFIHASRLDYTAGPSYRLALLVDNKLAGVVALEQISPMHRRAHIGYWLSADCQGRGYMSTAVRAIIDYAFRERGLQILELRAATDNRQSRAVAERVGMHFDGVLRQREWLYDHYVDHAVYSILASEWQELA